MAQEAITINWPGWEVVRRIGGGSYGSVYEIRRDNFGIIEHAALKVISIPQNSSDIEDLYSEGYDPESISIRFQNQLEDITREYSFMADMKGHTNIVCCDDLKYIQHQDGIGWDIYIKMELLKPLTKTLSGSITDEQVIRLGMDMCTALTLCKRRNIVHRDIKPQNILVSADGNYKLGDFGIAKTAERTTTGTKAGTFNYMAPEVYKHEPYGAAADIYSLGLVMYWMLNQRRGPFLPPPPHMPTANMEEEARRRRYSGEALPPPAHGSRALQAIVLKACAYDPKDRYTAAADMLQDLKALAQSGEDDNTVVQDQQDGTPTEIVKEPEVSVHTSGQPEDGAHIPETSSSKNKLLMGLLAVLGVLVIILAVLLLKRGSDSGDPPVTTNAAAADPIIQTTQPNPEPVSAETEVLLTGWQQSGADLYYYGSDGCMVTGWAEVDGFLRCFGSDGKMLLGWHTIDGLTYAFDGTGIPLTGWQTDPMGVSYYLSRDTGAALTGWQYVDGETYHFKGNGALCQSEAYEIDGITYHFDSNGQFSRLTSGGRGISLSPNLINAYNKAGVYIHGSVWAFDRMLEDCSCLDIIVLTADTGYAHEGSEWAIFYQTKSGWVRGRDITMSGNTAVTTITFGAPTDIIAYAALCLEPGMQDISFHCGATNITAP